MSLRRGLLRSGFGILLCCGMAAAQETQGTTGAEELTRTLIQKGVLTAQEGDALLERFARERTETPLVSLGFKGASVRFTGLGQMRFAAGNGAHSAADGTTPSFRVNTARFGFLAQATRTFSLYTLFAFERVNGDAKKVNSALYDFKLTYSPSSAFNISAGQMVIPVSGETLEATAKLDLPDRYFAQSRMLNPFCNHDIGVLLHGMFPGKRMEYAAGMFNGAGPNVTSNEDDHFIYSARVAQVPYRGKAFGREAELRLGAGGMWEKSGGDASSLRSDAAPGTTFTSQYHRLVCAADAQISWGGSRLKGEALAAELRGRRNNDPIVRASGWYVQASQLLAKAFEPLVRYQAYDPDERVITNKNVRWTTVGLNWYFSGYNAKLQTAYTFKRERAAGYANDELVSQFQVYF